MFQLNENFDYEAILKSYSIQDIVLEKSYKQKLEDYRNYEEQLQSYRDVKRKFSDINETHQNLRTRFAEQLNIKRSLLQLQSTPNSKLNAIQRELQNLQAEMSKDSDNFVNSVNEFITKFQNLGAEFDESAILNKETECTEDLNMNESTNTEKQKKFDDLTTQLHHEYENGMDLSTMKKVLNHFSRTIVLTELDKNISENERQMLTVVIKNIEFLKQNNRELQEQYNIID